MTLHHAIWTVGANPTPLAAAQLPSEQLLEDMIVAAPQMLSDAWMLSSAPQLNETPRKRTVSADGV
ncbi:hypothetical protein, partial [Muricoccus vinaceus]